MLYAIKNLVDGEAPSGRLVQGEKELEAGDTQALVKVLTHRGIL